jgi:proline iminopeptidase
VRCVALLALVACGARPAAPPGAPPVERAARRVCLALPGGPGIDAGYLRSPELERHARIVYLDRAGIAEIESARAALGLERVCLIGHSYGGTVALTYATAQPGRVERLVLYSATARTEAGFAAAARAGLERRRARHPDAAAAYDTRPATDDEAALLFARAAPLYVAEWRPSYAAALARSRASAAAMTAPMPAIDLRPELARVAAPTLVLAGRHDFLCGPAFAEELAAGIAGARLVIFEKSGHLAHLEEPGAFERALASFL